MIPPYLMLLFLLFSFSSVCPVVTQPQRRYQFAPELTRLTESEAKEIIDYCQYGDEPAEKRYKRQENVR